jgi:hypothetical protein
MNLSRVTSLKCFPRGVFEDEIHSRQRPFHVIGMHGLGDNIYARAFVRQLPGEVYLSTPWPQLYKDLPNVKFVPCSSRLRTQAKNISTYSVPLTSIPTDAQTIQVQYTVKDFANGSLIDGIKRCFGVEPGEFSLPEFDSPVLSTKPIAVIRPVTVRSEWKNLARNPDAAYVSWIAEQLKETHHIVSVADLEKGKEWLDGEEPFAHQRFHNGELNIQELLGLIGKADIVVGGVGWIVPACLSLGTKAFIVMGGHGGHNAPEKIIPSGVEHRITFAMPDKFCRCTSMQHRCNKTISNLEEQWSRFMTA